MMRQRSRIVGEDILKDTLSFQIGRVITTASKISLFDRIGNKYRQVHNFKRPKENKETLIRMCNVLVGYGLLLKKKNTYKCTNAAMNYLTAKSKHDLRPILQLSHRTYEMWNELEDAVTKGQKFSFKHASKGHFNPNFIHGMESRAHSVKNEIGTQLYKEVKKGKVLDLGGGSGIFVRDLVSRNKHLEGVVADLPHVIKVASGYIRTDKLEKQVTVQALDLIKDKNYGNGYDLVIISAILHIFDEKENQRIIRKAARTLKPGGSIAIIDYIMNNQRTDPLRGALFGIHMLLATDSGYVYTEKEYKSWLSRAGLGKSRRVNLKGHVDMIIGRK